MNGKEHFFAHVHILNKFIIEQIDELGLDNPKEQLAVFKDYISDLISSLTWTLDNYRLWGSGRDKLDDLLLKRVQLQHLLQVLFDRFDRRILVEEEIVIEEFRQNLNTVRERLTEISVFFLVAHEHVR